MAEKIVRFQDVLEALEAARAAGILAVEADKTTMPTDDQDCYPCDIVLDLERNDLRWPALRFLAKHFDWVSLESRRKNLRLRAEVEMRYRLTELGYLSAIAEILNERGFNCVVDMYYR